MQTDRAIAQRNAQKSEKLRDSIDKGIKAEYKSCMSQLPELVEQLAHQKFFAKQPLL